MELSQNDLELLLRAARGHNRELGRMRDDLTREGLVDIDINDALFDTQLELGSVIAKLQVMTGLISA